MRTLIKKVGLTTTCILLVGIFSIINAQSLALPTALKGKIPFDFEALEKAPKFRWEHKRDSVWSLFYEGETFNEQPTEVFAYYASPATLSGKKSRKEKYPAVVALHGGGGTAFAVWVREWAKKGYAAIAMDLGGAQPLPEAKQERPWATASNPLPNGAPDDTDVHKFYSINKDFSNQWQYHVVANVIRAHSLLRSFKDTDTSRTALTGISWGGYLTNMVSGIDHRFKAAVPIYGCGFLQEKSAWLSRFDSLKLETSKKWIELWEPSSYVGNARMPMLYINGTNDRFYHVESWQKTIDKVSHAEQLLIHEMVHNHKDGAAPPEIEKFIRDAFNQNRNVPILSTPRKIGKWYELDLKNGESIQEAVFIFTKDTAKNHERKWEILPAKQKDNKLLATGSHDIKLAYFLVTDQNGMRLSSPVIFN